MRTQTQLSERLLEHKGELGCSDAISICESASFVLMGREMAASTLKCMHLTFPLRARDKTG